MTGSPKFFRKLFTKPVWWWERRRSYAIRSQFYKLPPLPIKKSAARLVVLTTPASVNDALWTAWSWHRFLRDQFELQLVIDGRLTDGQTQSARKLFPGLRIFEAGTLLADLKNALPLPKSFLNRHPLGKKLGIVLALQQESSLLFSDHDVLAFNAPTELLACVQSNQPGYISEAGAGVFDAEIIQRATALGLDHAHHLNSGLLYVPQNSLSIEIAAKLLADWHPPMRSWFTEQTVLSVLMQQANAVSLPRERYVVSNQRQFYWEADVDYSAITARHFTGPTRHVMYGRGMPIILGQGRGSERKS